MSTAEERLRILKMVEDGQITPEEGAKLIKALNTRASAESKASRPRGEARWLRVRITDADNQRIKVNLNIPMGLVRTGLKLGARFIPADANVDFDYQSVIEAIENGETGKIAETYTDDGEFVEVWLE